MMRQIVLGENTGLRVSSLAFGTGRLGTTPGGGVDPAEARGALAMFADAGGTFLDTSSAYQGGQAEEMIGAFMADAGRDRFVVASKFGRTPHPDAPSAAVGAHRRAMQSEVEGSLRRLRTDRIEVYFAHFDDGITPMEEIVRGFDDLARSGKIVHAGLSNFPAWRIASAAVIAELRGCLPVAVMQLQYSLLERAIEREHLPLAKVRGIGVMGFSPLAGGSLTKPAPGAADLQGADGIRGALAAVAAESGSSPSAVALAWAARDGVIPVIGARTREQLSESLAAAGVTLSSAQLERLDGASALKLGYPYDLLAQQRESLGIHS